MESAQIDLTRLLDLAIASLDEVEASHQRAVSALQESFDSRVQAIETAAKERIMRSAQNALRHITGYKNDVEEKDALIESLQKEVKNLRASLTHLTQK